jgi:hypothetical protein
MHIYECTPEYRLIHNQSLAIRGVSAGRFLEGGWNGEAISLGGICGSLFGVRL